METPKTKKQKHHPGKKQSAETLPSGKANAIGGKMGKGGKSANKNAVNTNQHHGGLGTGKSATRNGGKQNTAWQHRPQDWKRKNYGWWHGKNW